MKIKNNDEVVVKVKGNVYGCYGEGGEYFSKTYKGTWEKVLNKISKVHSYGWLIGEECDDEGTCLTSEDLLESIEGSNGDGCDYIIEIIVTKGDETWTIIENEEIEIDCD